MVLLLGMGAARGESRSERSFAVFPRQELTVRFDHKKHLAQEMDCETCHAVAASAKASDLNLPKESDCTVCHDVEAAKNGKPADPPSGCSVCHPGFDHTAKVTPPRWSFPTPNLHFPHKVHHEKKVACQTCHGDMREVALGTRQNLPKMETCLKCHDGRTAPSRCATCHLAEPSRRLQTAFENTRALLMPSSGNPQGVGHTARFEKEHGTRAMIDSATCSECHGTTDCLRCHDALTKPPNVHPNDFMTLHPAAARTDTPRCDSCHRRQTFCAACHEQVGIGKDADPALRAKNVRVHPDLGIWVVGRGPGHHGLAASRDITACAACHREETCTACHSEQKTGSFGFTRINPHPPGFRAVCRSIAAKNDRACGKCHAPASLEALGCR
jgi:hypothetical protein